MKKEYESFIEAKRELCINSDSFAPAEYSKYDVKKGLRDSTGNGVIVGLTEVSQVDGYATIDGVKTEVDGILRYRGYSIEDLTQGFLNKRFGFEEVSYLVLFGKLPNENELKEFRSILNQNRKLPKTFTRDVIMKAAPKNSRRMRS